MSVTVNNNSPIQDYVHSDNQTLPTFEMSPGFKPSTQFLYLDRKIVERIDKDNDGKITEKELEDWIGFTRMQNHYDQVDKRWKDLKQREKNLVSRKDFHGDKNVDPDGPVSWEIYKIISFGKNPGNITGNICVYLMATFLIRYWANKSSYKSHK